jgi:hypothetical protein
MRYKLAQDKLSVRRDDGACIPADPANHDYAEYLDWLAAGNKPDPADIIVQTDEQPVDATAPLMARVGDEVVALLIRKGLIALDELSPDAQAIIAERPAPVALPVALPPTLDQAT